MSGSSEKDRELDAYLRGDSTLSKVYKEDARELPPAHVDAQILAEAHRAGAASGKPLARSPFSGSWMVPASVAAVVVLAVSVAVLLPEGRPDLERWRDRSEDAATPAADAPVTETLPQRESKQSPAADYAPPPPPSPESDEAAPGAARPEASAASPAEAVPPASQQRPVLKKESAPADVVRPDAPRVRGAPRPRAAAPGDIGATAEEGLAGSAKSEAFNDPVAWLERIRALIDREQLDAARESLVEFRRLYPDTEVPREIIEALGGGQN